MLMASLLVTAREWKLRQQKPSEVAMKRNEVESNPRTGSDFDHLTDQGGRWHDLVCAWALKGLYAHTSLIE